MVALRIWSCPSNAVKNLFLLVTFYCHQHKYEDQIWKFKTASTCTMQITFFRTNFFCLHKHFTSLEGY